MKKSLNQCLEKETFKDPATTVQPVVRAGIVEYGSWHCYFTRWVSLRRLFNLSMP
jgi:hypothetical protein